ncbi:hypothetical protein N798_01385 [Knoellia flava TL1]|uniref:GP-PDE domain-containing protein n=2 Tax=Knoellia flava TaxID=913969 RepID=A0A8H9FVY8_9MICO|nr:glycerophosphodiester phosphodiesterase family protein [Knoellia flava]KGN36055.1 hypothetical protein N798_01385 [Knoellia flava TL1]GGB79606.1 hypothetical protein GCM10011314_19030 [Knoellia flava]
MSTLELDTQVTEDEKVVVTHDRQVSRTKCADTGPAFPGDPEFPYVGDYVKNLTLAQIRTMDCGYQQLPGHPQQEQVRGARMAELRDIFDVVKGHGASRVTLGADDRPGFARAAREQLLWWRAHVAPHMRRWATGASRRETVLPKWVEPVRPAVSAPWFGPGNDPAGDSVQPH